MRDFKNIKRIVVKIRTSSLTHTNTQKINIDRIDKLAREISNIMNSGIQVILVTSGAIATGMAKLGLTQKPTKLATKQMLACVGQSCLMELYNKCFADYGYNVGQLLLTKYTIDHEPMRENTQNCINEMLENNIIPIINENDSISVDEIKLGDNDNLSSIVAKLVNADLLVLLTDLDGLYNCNPKTNKNAIRIEEVNDINSLEIEFGETSTLGTGGMQTKLQACKDVTNFNIEAIIAPGYDLNVLTKILNGTNIGTHFITHK